MTSAVAPPRKLVLVWVAAAVFFGSLLAVARAAEGPLDDTDPALQRPGFLDAGALPIPASNVTDDVPTPGRRSVVFFTRPDRLGRLCHAVGSHDFDDEVDVVIVVSGTDGRCAGGTRVLTDPATTRAERYGMREPRGGGAAVGYAVVDADGLVRYRTLDPAIHDELGEVDTILEALK